MSRMDRESAELRRWSRLVVVFGVLLAALSPASRAWAHGDGETAEGYQLVQQALGHLAHDTGHTGVMDAMEKVDDALNTDDQEGVDVALLTRAQGALDADRVSEARALLQQSITEAVSGLKPATGEETGTTVVLLPLRGRGGLTGQDWGFGSASLLLLVVGLALAVRFRPHDNLRQLRRQLAPAEPPRSDESAEVRS